jgi:hypothetical protein
VNGAISRQVFLSVPRATRSQIARLIGEPRPFDQFCVARFDTRLFANARLLIAQLLDRFIEHSDICRWSFVSQKVFPIPQKSLDHMQLMGSILQKVSDFYHDESNTTRRNRDDQYDL